MFIRLRSNKSGTTTVYLIDSVRVGGKKNAIAKVIKCFGSSSDLGVIEQWKSEAENLKRSLINQNINSSNITNIKQESDIMSCRVNELGIKYLYSKIFKSLFSKFSNRNLDKDLLSDLVIMRIARPVSKLRTAFISEDFGITGMTPNKIYRLMDEIDDSCIETIKRHVLKNTKKVLNNKIRVMFYDLTTIYFESNEQSELKEFGYSKDGKSQHVQLSLVLIVTESGLPVGYEIFKGNTFEGSTLIPVLYKLKQEYYTEDVTVVADSAMLSQKNIDALIKNNYKFIVSARVKNMTTKLRSAMLEEEGYSNLSEGFRYKSILLDAQKKLVTVYSEDRRRKDEYERNKTLEKLSKLEGKRSKCGLRGSIKKQYVKVKNDSVIEVDKDKVEENKKYDGYFGFISNTDLKAEEIIEQYKGLWQIEQSFRITKSNLKVRPIYHYSDRRIKAHFAICYMSLALVRNLEFRLKTEKKYMPLEELHYQLSQIKAVKIVTKETEASIITDIPEKISELLYALKIEHPSRYLAKCRV